MSKKVAVWFPAVKTNTGTDVFTERLVKSLQDLGAKAEITWLPLRAEYAPWTVSPPSPPTWANVVHVNSWLHPKFIPKNIPLVTTIHHSVHHPDALSYKNRIQTLYHKHWIAPIERRVIQRANKVIAVSQLVSNTAKQTLLNVPVQVINNGVNVDIFKPTNSPKARSAPFRLLYVGSWIARKGVDLIPSIMRKLGHDFELLYTGSSLSKTEKLQMPKNMKDIGKLQGELAVAKAMQQADALLFPSRSEGHPLVGIEAMACGLPVIAMAQSSIIEMIKDGITGYLCEPDNTQDFANKIRILKENSELRRSMASNARTDALHRFSSVIMTQRYLECYDALI